MGEYASRGRGHESSYAPRSSSYAETHKAPERTPAERATQEITSFNREVQAITTTLEAVRKAHESNNPAQWHPAKETLGRQIERAHKSHERARSNAHDGTTESKQQFAAAETLLAQHEASAATLNDAPRGWNPISRESEILAVLVAPIEGGANAGYARKEQVLKAEISLLTVAESRQLVARLRKHDHSDPIANAFARLVPERRDRIADYLNGARKREAQAAARSGTTTTRDATTPPAFGDRVHAQSPFDWTATSIVLGEPAREDTRPAPTSQVSHPGEVFVPEAFRGVAITTSDKASSKTAAPEPALSKTATALYLSKQYVHAWAAIGNYVGRMVWPQVSDRLSWNESAFTAQLLKALEGSIGSFDPAVTSQLLHPQDVFAAIESYVPAKNSDHWVPAVGLILGQAFAAVLAPAVRRMTSRYVDAADALQAASPTSAVTVELHHLVTSQPLDRLIARSLVTLGRATVAPDADIISGKRKAPRLGLRSVTLTWEGKRNPKLWNFVRAEPADATPEEVAASLFSYARDKQGDATSYYSYGFASAAPLFGLPAQWAVQFPDARAHAPTSVQDGKLPDQATDTIAARMAALASTSESDEVALAQTSGDPRAKSITSAQLTETADDCMLQLGQMRGLLVPWGLANDIGGEMLYVHSKKTELAHASPAQVAAWAPIALGQRDRLYRISRALQSVATVAGSINVDKSSSAVAPLRGVLALLSEAAATSHLEKTSDQIFAEAMERQASLSLRSLQSNIVELESNMDYSHLVRGSDRFNRDLARPYQEAKDDAQRIETKLLNGGQVSAEEIERVQINAQEMSLRLRAQAIQKQLDALTETAIKVQAGIMSHIVGNGRFKSIPAAAMHIHKALGEIQYELNQESKQVKPMRDGDELPGGLPPELAARKAAVTRAQQRFADLYQDKDLATFFDEAYKSVRSQQLKTAIAQAAVMVGIGIASAGIGSAVSEGLAGGYMAAQGVQTIAELSAGARVAIQVGAMGTEIMGNALGQHVTTAGQPGAGSFADALIDNAIFAIGSAATVGVMTNELRGAAAFEKALTEQFVRIESQEARAAIAMSTLAKTGRVLAWPIKQAGQITGHTIMGMALGTVAEARKRHPKQQGGDADASQLESFMIQGASVALGRLAHGAMSERMAVYAQLAKRKDLARAQQLYVDAQHLQQLAAKLTANPDAHGALNLLHERTRVLETELAVLDELAARQPTDAAHAGPTAPEIAQMRSDLKAQLADVRSQGMLEVQWHLVGLHELAPGLWKGTRKQIDASVAEARANQHEVKVSPDEGDGVTRVTIDGKTIELHVTEPAKSAASSLPRVNEERVPAKSSELAGQKTAAGDQVTQEMAPGAFEVTAAAVPGSSYKGKGEHSGSEGELLGQANHAIDEIAAGRREVAKIEHAHVDQAARADLKIIATNTHVIHLADNTSITVRVSIAPLEGQDVARSVMNPTKQGITHVERAGEGVKVEHIDGRYVIQLSDKMDPAHVRRAVAHEVAEILARRQLFLENKLPGQDALRAGSSAVSLSPHDHGRLAEINELASDLRNGDAATKERARHELMALVEELGLRHGVAGAEARFEKAKADLSAAAIEELSKARAGESQLSEAEAKKLAWTREEARSDREAQAAFERAHAPLHEMPKSGLDHKATKAERIALARKARVEREQRSAHTLHEVRAANATGTHPKMRIQIGGNASLSARDPHALLVDANQRWAADRSEHLAQTAQQMEPIKAAGIGDPYEFADAGQRVPLEAIHFWQDKIAAQGPMIDGYAELGLASDGRTMLATIHPNDGSAPVIVEVDGVPVVSTGFTHENAPGARGKSPRQALLEIDTALAALSADPRVGEMAKQARKDLAKLKGINEADAKKALDAIPAELHGKLAAWQDPTVKNPGPALDILEATKSFAELRANDPGHLFYGDEANQLSDAQIARMHEVVIAGPGGTGISAAEIILSKNAQAHVTMIGKDSPAGLAENDQFRAVVANHGTRELCARLHIEPGRLDGRFEIHDGYYLGAVKKVNGKYDVNARAADTQHGALPETAAQGDTYISAMGRFEDLPPPVAALANEAERAGAQVTVRALYDDDAHYAGYEIIIRQPDGRETTVDVTGAASRYVESTKLPAEEKKSVKASSEHDAPSESGLFDGSFAASARQGARYQARRRARGY